VKKSDGDLILITHVDYNTRCAGAAPGFQVRGAHLKKLRRVEGGANIFGVFRVKNHDFTPKNQFFFQF
jgi:hypothetical protein